MPDDGALHSAEARGPLYVCPRNPRYFTDGSGRAILLTGSHTWTTLQDWGVDTVQTFDFASYLDFLERYHHNFIRMWAWEQAEGGCWTDERVVWQPLPYVRSGPGLAQDGKPKFDLDTWNPEYFERLRSRVVAAGRRGVYVSVMLFQGFSLNRPPDPGEAWRGHPLNPLNNLTGEGPEYPNIDQDGLPSLHSLAKDRVLERQHAYVRKVIETVNDLDNVLYEIINEGGTTDWQYHLIDFVHQTEASMAKQHPVGMTNRSGPPQHNAVLFSSPAEWVSPAPEPRWDDLDLLEDYKDNPPANDGRKVVLSDTDHLWGHGGSYRWVWKSVLRGLNPIFMDPYSPVPGRLCAAYAWTTSMGELDKNTPDYPDWEPLRSSMGYARRYAERMDLAASSPRSELVSTRYCLAHPGHEYLVYLPEGGSVTVNLVDAPGEYQVEWFIPLLGRTYRASPVSGGDYRRLRAPFTGDVVLYLEKQ
jgi:hypothetical protein